jgi:uncharacterized protein DUF4259
MGAWGTGIFENDGAGDFLADLKHHPSGWSLIRQTLERDGDRSPSKSEAAVAAAECVAIARGKPSSNPNPRAVDWCKAHPASDLPKLAALAVKVVREVRSSSELKDLWDGDEEWDAIVGDLEKRLL